MRVSGMDRMRRALTAIKMTEMAQLGAKVRAAEAARAEARDLREQSRLLPPPATAQDMALQTQYQLALEAQARAALARAATAQAEAAPISARLARTLGRENVTTHLIELEAKEIQRVQDRRAEDDAVKRRDPTIT